VRTGLDLLLTSDGRQRIARFLIANEPVDIAAAGEAFESRIPMFGNATRQMVRHTSIKYDAPTIG